jgi:hypothetical protein
VFEGKMIGGETRIVMSRWWDGRAQERKGVWTLKSSSSQVMTNEQHATAHCTRTGITNYYPRHSCLCYGFVASSSISSFSQLVQPCRRARTTTVPTPDPPRRGPREPSGIPHFRAIVRRYRIAENSRQHPSASPQCVKRTGFGRADSILPQ